MREPQQADDHMSEQRRIRRSYLVLVLGSAGTLSLLGLILSILGLVVVVRAVFHPGESPAPGIAIPLLIGGAVHLIIGAKLVDLSGLLRVSVPSVKVKANVDSMPSEALLAPPRPAEKPARDEGMAAEALIARFQESFRGLAEDAVELEIEHQVAKGGLPRERRRKAGPQPSERKQR